jgi:hypothetical protein
MLCHHVQGRCYLPTFRTRTTMCSLPLLLYSHCFISCFITYDSYVAFRLPDAVQVLHWRQ